MSLIIVRVENFAINQGNKLFWMKTEIKICARTQKPFTFAVVIERFH